ncbi:YidH family protein [Microbacterium immunditiarum]|uniref:Putative membrane protein n=1 Tax=Microbacterium immunditiarum TaxID=337480 RepID=A0A7Y9GRX5_9MICO|nr:putative membrane protein [Microbacterium immunditiarum]
MANERTFLAWIRSSVALVAGGVALVALRVPIDAGFRVASAIVFISLGMLAAIQAWIGWARTERALRENRALPGPALGVVITVGVLAGTALIVVGSVV